MGRECGCAVSTSGGVLASVGAGRLLDDVMCRHVDAGVFKGLVTDDIRSAEDRICCDSLHPARRLLRLSPPRERIGDSLDGVIHWPALTGCDDLRDHILQDCRASAMPVSVLFGAAL
jgi:hypothetical protein